MWSTALGTAVFFALVGGVVLAAGRALIIGKRWGRGLAVFTQLLLLPVACTSRWFRISRPSASRWASWR